MFKYLTTTAIVAAAMPAAALAQQAPIQFDIQASDTATALNRFANQAGVHLVFPYDAVANRRVAALRGRFTRAEALRRLIAGQGLVVASETPSMISLKVSPTETRDAAPVAVADAGATGQDIVVLGQGQSRQVQTVSVAAMEKTTAGTSPLRSLGRLPGVNFDSSDAHGTYEAATQLSIRGFITDQMGYTLDGVPLGNMQYRNNNGLSINRALLSENNGGATLSQGSGALGTASTSNIGGTVDFTSIEPTAKFGLDLQQSYGSEDSWRSFVRMNSGDLAWGGRLAISYAHDRQGKWRGWGKQEQDQLNAKYVQPLGDAVTSTTFLNLIDRREDDYNDLSLAKIKQYGWNFDNIESFQTAEDLARIVQNGGTVPAPYVNADDAVYNGGGVRRDLLAYEKLEYQLGTRLSGFTTAYIHLDKGIGTWATPYDPTPEAYGGSPISVSALRYNVNRKGGISRLMFQAGDHKIEGGIWYEHNAFEQGSYLYGLEEGVTPKNFQKFYTNPFTTNWHYQFATDTVQLDIGDTWQATDRLRERRSERRRLQEHREHDHQQQADRRFDQGRELVPAHGRTALPTGRHQRILRRLHAQHGRLRRLCLQWTLLQQFAGRVRLYPRQPEAGDDQHFRGGLPFPQSCPAALADRLLCEVHQSPARLLDQRNDRGQPERAPERRQRFFARCRGSGKLEVRPALVALRQLRLQRCDL